MERSKELNADLSTRFLDLRNSLGEISKIHVNDDNKVCKPLTSYHSCNSLNKRDLSEYIHIQ